MAGVTRNNLRQVAVDFPLGVFTTVTGVSGSGKSSLVSHVLVELVAEFLGHELPAEDEELDLLERTRPQETGGRIAAGGELITRLVRVDQKPIGRSPRSNMATYTGMFDHIRRLFAATKMARARRYDAGRFSFNVGKGRCEHCQGEGFVMVELLFLPSVYAPCPTCHGTRYSDKTLEVTYREKNIAQVLALTVDSAWEFFADEPALRRALGVLREVGLGYLRLGQPATELSGGEAQRIKLGTELQRVQHGSSLYVLDEPTTGLHPLDVEKLLAQLGGLVDSGNTVIVVEHDMQVIARSDWVIDIGSGAGDEGGRVVATGTPANLLGAQKESYGTLFGQISWVAINLLSAHRSLTGPHCVANTGTKTPPTGRVRLHVGVTSRRQLSFAMASIAVLAAARLPALPSSTLAASRLSSDSPTGGAGCLRIRSRCRLEMPNATVAGGLQRGTDLGRRHDDPTGGQQFDHGFRPHLVTAELFCRFADFLSLVDQTVGNLERTRGPGRRSSGLFGGTLMVDAGCFGLCCFVLRSHGFGLPGCCLGMGARGFAFFRRCLALRGHGFGLLGCWLGMDGSRFEFLRRCLALPGRWPGLLSRRLCDCGRHLRILRGRFGLGDCRVGLGGGCRIGLEGGCHSRLQRDGVVKRNM